MNKRYAVLSDIHGNVWALQAVLEDAAKRDVTDYVNLGDTFYGPLKPKDTFELLRDKDFFTISGNQDRLIIDCTSEEIDSSPTLQYVLEDLPDEALEWLRRLPRTLVLDKEIFLCHGAPGDDATYLLEDISSGLSNVRDNRAISNLLEGCDCPTILCGHSHVPRFVQLSFGQMVINPGSVGLPAYSDNHPTDHRMETFSHHASYVLMEKQNDSWRITHIRVPYPYYEATRQAGILGREDWGYALLTGRARG